MGTKQLEKFVSASRGVADCPDSRLVSGFSWTRSGHNEFPFNWRAGKHCPRRCEVHLQLLLVLRSRLAGFQLENCHAAVAALDEAVKRASQDRLRGTRANGERHFEQRVTGFEGLRERALSAQCEIRAACLTEHLFDIACLDCLFIPNQPRELVRDRLSRSVPGKRCAEALEQPMYEGAREAAAARVDLIAAPLLHCGREHSRYRNTRDLERIDERREIVG